MQCEEEEEEKEDQKEEEKEEEEEETFGFSSPLVVREEGCFVLRGSLEA